MLQPKKQQAPRPLQWWLQGEAEAWHRCTEGPPPAAVSTSPSRASLFAPLARARATPLAAVMMTIPSAARDSSRVSEMTEGTD